MGIVKVKIGSDYPALSQRCPLRVGCFEYGACCGFTWVFPRRLGHGWLIPLGRFFTNTELGSVVDESTKPRLSLRLPVRINVSWL